MQKNIWFIWYCKNQRTTCTVKMCKWTTLQEINISHLGKFGKSSTQNGRISGDMLVPRRGIKTMSIPTPQKHPKNPSDHHSKTVAFPNVVHVLQATAVPMRQPSTSLLSDVGGGGGVSVAQGGNGTSSGRVGPCHYIQDLKKKGQKTWNIKY